jgi:hypothetical protein
MSGLPSIRFFFDPSAFGRAVAALAAVRGGPVELYELGIVHVTEGALNSLQIGSVAV